MTRIHPFITLDTAEPGLEFRPGIEPMARQFVRACNVGIQFLTDSHTDPFAMVENVEERLQEIANNIERTIDLMLKMDDQWSPVMHLVMLTKIIIDKHVRECALFHFANPDATAEVMDEVIATISQTMLTCCVDYMEKIGYSAVVESGQ